MPKVLSLRLFVFVLLSAAGLASAQTTHVDTTYLRLSGGPCRVSAGVAAPSGGADCDVYVKADGTLWQRAAGVWVKLGVGYWTRTGTALMPTTAGDTVGGNGYASQTTGWRITDAGAGDFRSLYTDELQAKSFIADLEQALAGSQIISKSVALLGAAYLVPAKGAASTITVKDLPSAPGMAVFESGDTLRLRTFSRASGSLTIADAYGVVTSHVNLGGGLQTWTFTRNSGANGGGMAEASVTLPVKTIVLDYGVSGNGFYEVNAVDGLYGVNSPYSQVATWATSPIAANLAVRVRTGNLLGITGSAEYGLLAGAYAATNGTFFRASDTNFDLSGITAKWWDSTTNVITIAPNSGSPYLGLGNPAPSTFGSAGLFLGWDHSATKAKLSAYSDASNFLKWDGANLSWKGTNASLGTDGNLTVTGGTIGGFTVTSNTISAGTGATIVFDNGAFMRVSGTGFGSTNQFVEWWGPHFASLTSCTEANATYYLKTDGTAYFGGALLAGVLKNTVTGTVLNNTNSAVLGPYASNGNTITINWSLDFYSTKAYVPSDSAGWTAADRTAPTATLKLERSVSGGSYSTVWNNTVCNGSVDAESPNGSDPGFISKTVVCSGTYTDPDHNTNTRAYRLSFVSDSHVFLPGVVVRNNLSLVSVEQ